MSNVTYNELWKSTQSALQEIIRADTILQSSEPHKDRKKAHYDVADLYVRYVVICNNLNECYDQIVQPQKRLVIRKLLDSTLGRAVELKHELVEIDLSEYNYYDDVLLKYNILPQEAEIQVPTYFLREREKEIAERRKFIQDTLRNLGTLEEKPIPKIMTEAEAIRMIQKNERARQGRMRFQFMKEICEIKDRSIMKSEPAGSDKASGTAAILKIQKVWRGYMARREVKKRRIEEMFLIGMLQPSQVITESVRQIEQTKLRRHEKQLMFQECYEKLVVETESRIRSEKTALIEEKLRTDIRNWIKNCFERTGKIPDLPSAESGGSRLIFSRQDSDSNLSRSSEVSSKKSKKSKSKDEESEQSEEESDPGFKPIPSNFLAEIIQADQEYQDTWKDKDESMNFAQEPYLDMIEDEKTKLVVDEVRVVVDEAMREDIEALQIALDRDMGIKGKRQKPPAKKVRRSGKKNKKKKEKDLTPDRSTESLLEELLENGIVKFHPEIRLSSFKGEKSYANFDLREADKDPLPSLGDIKQVITEYCIIPLGNETIRELTPLVRSVLITGPQGSGKKMLVNAICTELGATLFDLTPANIAGKYPGKPGLIMLMHLISKVSRLLQPSVIFMDGAEKPFVKKVPKTDKTDPKRLKKDLIKFVKSIMNDDRIIVIGTSSAPWDADQKLLFQTYDKIIYVPRPDYGTMSLIWRDLLFKYAGISRQFDISSMTRACDGYTIGKVLEAINEIMTTKRMVQLRVQPLTHGELVNALSLRDPVYREEEDTFLAWLTKTPMAKKKQRAIELELQRLEEEMEKLKASGKK